MANERALGLSFIYAAQTWRQLVVCYGEDEARALFGLTNNLVIFGGGKDVHFYREISDLLDDVRISRHTVTDGPGGVGTSRAGEDVRVLRPGDIRRIRDRHALVVAGNAPPIIARLRRCIDGRRGRALTHEMTQPGKRSGRPGTRRLTSPRVPEPRSPTPATTTCTTPTHPRTPNRDGRDDHRLPGTTGPGHPGAAPPTDPHRQRPGSHRPN